MARELIKVVILDGEIYGPGYTNPPPDSVAEQITNASVWGDEADSSPQGGEPEEVVPAVPDVVSEPVEGVGIGQPHPAVVEEPTPVEVVTEEPAEVVTEESAAPVVEEPKDDDVEVPPRSGAGSGADAWRAFATAKGVTVGPEDRRDDIIEACEKAKVI